MTVLHPGEILLPGLQTESLSLFPYMAERESSLVSLLVRPPILLNQGLIFMTSYNFNYLPGGPLSKYSPIGGLSFSVMNLGGTQLSPQGSAKKWYSHPERPWSSAPLDFSEHLGRQLLNGSCNPKSQAAGGQFVWLWWFVRSLSYMCMFTNEPVTLCYLLK